MSDVFISYSRKDIAFARLIHASFQRNQIDTWIDWERIPVGQNWWKEICEAIDQSNVFMFIISQNSLGSTVCKDEINHALKNNKRIIPILVDNLGPEVVAQFVPDLTKINWMIFERDHVFQIEEKSDVQSDKPEDRQVALPKLPQFEMMLERLNTAIHTDWDWVKYHTQLQVNGLLWNNNHQDASYLLQGTALEEAEQQLLRASGKDPHSTELQVEYITAGRQEEKRRQAEKQQLEQKARQRQRLALWAIGVGLVVAVLLGLVAWGQRNEAVSQSDIRATAESNAVAEAHSRATAEANAVSESHVRATAQAVAEDQRSIAEQQRSEAERQTKLALAGKLAAQSQLLFKDQLDLALLLSVEASQTAETSEVQLAPRLALEYSPRLRHFVKASSNGVAFAIRSDSRVLALAECIATVDTNYLRKCVQGRVGFIDIASGQPLGKPLDLGAFSAGYLAYNKLDGGKTLILVGYTSVAIWDIEQARLVGEYPTGQKETRYYPTEAAFSPDGRLLAIGSCSDRSKANESNGMCNQGEIRLWDIEKRQLYGQPIVAHAMDVGALAFSPDSRLLASAGFETLKLWAIPEPSAALEVKQVGEPIKTTDTVTSAIAFSADGKQLATGGSEWTITRWDVATHAPIGSPLVGHTYWISALRFSPDGKTLVSGSWDDSLILWDLASQQAIGKPFAGHSGDVVQLSFTPDGQGLVSADQKGMLALWNTGEQFAGSPLGRKLPSINNTSTFAWTQAFSPDGKILAYSIYNTVYLWDVQKNQPIGQPLTGHKDEVRGLVFPPQDNGKTLVSASRDHVAITWDVASGKSILQTGQDTETSISDATFTSDRHNLVYAGSRQGSPMILKILSGEPPQELSLTSGRIAIQRDGSLVAAVVCDTRAKDQSCVNWTIVTWDMANNRPAVATVTGLTNVPWALALSPNGQWLAYSIYKTGKITLADRLTGKTLKEITSSPGKILDATSLVFSPDGKLLAAAYLYGQLILWDTLSGQMVGQPFLEQYNLDKPVFSPDGKILAWPLEKAPFLWDIAAQKPIGQPLRKGDAGGSLAFSPDGKRISIGGGTGSLDNQAQVFDMVSGKALTELLNGHATTIIAVSFSANGQQLFTLSRDGTLDVWDLPDGKLVAQPLLGYLANFANVALSPDGRTLAITACKIKTKNVCTQSELWLQDTATGALTRQSVQLSASTSMVRFSHNAKLLAISSGPQVMVWDLAAQKTLYSFKNASRDWDALAFSPDDGILATKAEAVILWDLTSGKQIGAPITDKTINSSGDSLAGTEDWGVAFSPDGRRLATVGSQSGTLLLIDVISGQSYGPALLDQRNKLMTGMLLSVTFSPDGKSLASGNNSGAAFLWNIDPAAWRVQACATARRNMTPGEWATYMPVNEPYRKTCP